MTFVVDGNLGAGFPDGSYQPSSASPYVLKNRLVNGSFAIDQRNAGASQTFTAAAAVAYTVDRWYGSCTGANITGQRVAGTSPNQYAYRFTGAASNTATLFGQRIESFNTYDLISTTVTGSVTLKSSSITSVTWTAYYANSSDTFSSKTSIATGTLTINSTATRYSFSFNAGANAGNGIAIEFTTGALTATNTLQYENAQIEIGSTATPFERRLYNQELANCQRYCYRASYTGTGTPVGAGFWSNATLVATACKLATTMRAAPTLSYSAIGDIQCLDRDVAWRAGTSSLVINEAGTDVVNVGVVCTTGSTQGFGTVMEIRGSTGWLQFSSEL